MIDRLGTRLVHNPVTRWLSVLQPLNRAQIIIGSLLVGLALAGVLSIYFGGQANDAAARGELRRQLNRIERLETPQTRAELEAAIGRAIAAITPRQLDRLRERLEAGAEMRVEPRPPAPPPRPPVLAPRPPLLPPPPPSPPRPRANPAPLVRPPPAPILRPPPARPPAPAKPPPDPDNKPTVVEQIEEAIRPGLELVRELLELLRR